MILGKDQRWWVDDGGLRSVMEVSWELGLVKMPRQDSKLDAGRLGLPAV